VDEYLLLYHLSSNLLCVLNGIIDEERKRKEKEKRKRVRENKCALKEMECVLH
jgi:hypothetical protein